MISQSDVSLECLTNHLSLQQSLGTVGKLFDCKFFEEVLSLPSNEGQSDDADEMDEAQGGSSGPGSESVVEMKSTETAGESKGILSKLVS